MKRIIRTLLTGSMLGGLSVACGGDKVTGPQTQTCGGGQGQAVAFCRQVDNYVAGYGVPGQDVIRATCLVGPQGATVSNQQNGTYYCGGTYKLTSFPNAKISLNWGGSTSFSEAPQDYQITSPGEGTFFVKVVKQSGGAGNLFLSMSSGSNWMFDAVLVNTLCTAASVSLTRTELGGSLWTRREGSVVRTTIPWKYTAQE